MAVRPALEQQAACLLGVDEYATGRIDDLGDHRARAGERGFERTALHFPRPDLGAAAAEQAQLVERQVEPAQRHLVKQRVAAALHQQSPCRHVEPAVAETHQRRRTLPPAALDRRELADRVGVHPP